MKNYINTRKLLLAISLLGLLPVMAQNDTQRIVIRKNPKVIILRSSVDKNSNLKDSSENLNEAIQKLSKMFSVMADSFAKQFPDTSVFNLNDQSWQIFDSSFKNQGKVFENQSFSFEFNSDPDHDNHPRRRHYERIVFEPELSLGLMRNQNMSYGTRQPNGNYTGGMPELNAAKSLQLGIGSMWGYNLVRGKLRLWGGLKYYINNYRFRNPSVRLQADRNEFTYNYADSGSSEKSKVVVNYLSIPVAIGFKAGNRKALAGFWFKAGVDAGVMVRSHAKNVIKNAKNKNSDDFNFNDIDLAPFVEMGYNSFGLYARMHQTNVFKNNEGPSGKQFNVGVTMLF